MIGQKFGKWLVLEEKKFMGPAKHYKCQCECGNISIIRSDILKFGRSTKCMDCRRKEVNRAEEAILGKKMGKWTVIRRINFDGKIKRFECQCECGRIDSVVGSRLFRGVTKGCRKCATFKHGYDATPTLYTWRTMIARCTDPKRDSYKYYGAKGVTVCDRWKTFKNFLQDMGEKPEGLQLDRIDPYGNYEPSNCRWVTCKENNNNKRKHKPKPN